MQECTSLKIAVIRLKKSQICLPWGYEGRQWFYVVVRSMMKLLEPSESLKHKYSAVQALRSLIFLHCQKFHVLRSLSTCINLLIGSGTWQNVHQNNTYPLISSHPDISFWILRFTKTFLLFTVISDEFTVTPLYLEVPLYIRCDLLTLSEFNGV